MNAVKKVVVLLTIFVLGISISYAEGKKKKFTLESLRTHFEQTLSPKEQFHDTQRAALWFAKVGTKKALATFNHAPNEWHKLDGYHHFFVVLNCKEGHAAAHPNPPIRKAVVGKPNMIPKVRDHAGKATMTELCVKIAKQPKGAWIASHTTFVFSATKIPAHYTYAFGLKVPGLPYEVISWSPVRANSLVEAEAKAAALNKRVEEWSIIK